MTARRVRIIATIAGLSVAVSAGALVVYLVRRPPEISVFAARLGDSTRPAGVVRRSDRSTRGDPVVSVLEARDITKTFGEGDTATQVLRGVSVTIERGAFVALVGPSGSGKSTFLSIAGTLLTPTSGSLRIAGLEALGLHEHELAPTRNSHLGFVFQFHHLLEDFTALENVLMPVYGAQHALDATSRKRGRELLVRLRRPGTSCSRCRCSREPVLHVGYHWSIRRATIAGARVGHS